MTISAFGFPTLRRVETLARGIVIAATIIFVSWTSAAFAVDSAGVPAVANAPVSSKLPFKQQPEAEGNLMLRVFGGFVIVVLVGYGTVYALKRYFPSVVGQSVAGQRKINVLETRRLTPKATLFLVEVDGIRLLLAQSGDTLTKLHDLPGASSSVGDAKRDNN